MDGNIDLVSTESHRAIVAVIIEMRRERRRLMPPEWFSDPAWDILIDLYFASLCETATQIHDLWEVDDRPPPLIRRWCDVLIGSRIAYRQGDTIRLTDYGVDTMFHCFDRIARNAESRSDD